MAAKHEIRNMDEDAKGDPNLHDPKTDQPGRANRPQTEATKAELEAHGPNVVTSAKTGDKSARVERTEPGEATQSGQTKPGDAVTVSSADEPALAQPGSAVMPDVQKATHTSIEGAIQAGGPPHVVDPVPHRNLDDGALGLEALAEDAKGNTPTYDLMADATTPENIAPPIPSPKYREVAEEVLGLLTARCPNFAHGQATLAIVHMYARQRFRQKADGERAARVEAVRAERERAAEARRKAAQTKRGDRD
jgi:hypothetical protein